MKKNTLVGLIIALVVMSMLFVAVLGVGICIFINKNTSGGFDTREELIDACVESFIANNSEELVGYMHPQIIKTIARDNQTSVEEVKESVKNIYNREAMYYDEWIYDNGNAWSLSEKSFYLIPDDELIDERLEIAEYDYYGYLLLDDGAQKITGCDLIAEAANSEDCFSFVFTIAEYDGEWFLIGISV